MYLTSRYITFTKIYNDMKKSILILITTFLAINTINAQQGWRFSLGFDPMVTWMSAKDDLESDGSRLGFDFSIHAENYFSERYAFYTGLTYMNMGGKVKNVGERLLAFDKFNLPIGHTATLRTQYLVVPIGIKLHTAEFGMFSFYFNGGLYTGVRVGGSIKSQGDEKKHSIGGDTNLITAGCQFGAGLMYSLGGNTFLQGGLKFNYGFVDMLKTSALNAQPVGLGLHLGILF